MDGGRRKTCGHKDGSLVKYSRLFLGTLGDLVLSSFLVMTGRRTTLRRLPMLTMLRR